LKKIFAHRGASKVAPENTMAAFIKAKQLGAYGVELDVHVLPDKTVVVHHDATLGRCGNAEGSIYRLRRDTVKSFSVGEKFSLKFKSETIPLFEEVLVYLKENGLFLNCEIKNQSGFIYPYEDEVIKLINHYGMAQNAIISSFDHRILKNIKSKYENYKVAILYGETFGINVIDYCKQNNFDAINPYYGIVDENLVKAAHENNIAVNVWTVDNIEDIQRMCNYGVDSNITNDVEAGIKGARAANN